MSANSGSDGYFRVARSKILPVYITGKSKSYTPDQGVAPFYLNGELRALFLGQFLRLFSVWGCCSW
jgi:hypothetical protein